MHFELTIATADGCHPIGTLVGLTEHAKVPCFGRAKRAGVQTEVFARAGRSIERVSPAGTRASVMDTADRAAIRLWSQEDTGAITILCEQREQMPFGKMHQALGFALQVDFGG